MCSSLECELPAENDLPCLGHSLLTALWRCSLLRYTSGRRYCIIGCGSHRKISIRNRRQVFHPVIPCDITWRHISAAGETKQEGGFQREEIVVKVFDMNRFNLIGQSKIEKFMDRIKDVSAPIAEGTQTKVVPAPPVAGMILFVEIVEFGCREPGIPILIGHSYRQWLCLGEFCDIGIIRVPSPVSVHECSHCRDIPDDTGLFPCLELEVVLP